MTRILLLALIAAAILPAQTQIRDTGYTGIAATKFAGKVTISEPDMTTADGRTVLRWQQEFPIVNGVISFDLEPNDTAAPSGTSYLARFTPSRGGASAEWSQRWVVPTSPSPLKVNQIRTLVTPTPVIMIQPQQILGGGASIGQCLAFTGSSWGPIDCAAVGGAAVLSVFGRIGAVAPQSGDYRANQVTNALDATGSYVNPSWLSSIAWSKITGVPSFEPAIAGGSTTQYWRGDKTWQSISTTAVAEGANLYFTGARAQAAMAGLYESMSARPGLDRIRQKAGKLDM